MKQRTPPPTCCPNTLNLVLSQNSAAVQNLTELMTNIEQFKSEASACEELEEKLDKLTDQLVTAFDSKEDLVWENGKPDKFREYIWCNN